MTRTFLLPFALLIFFTACNNSDSKTNEAVADTVTVAVNETAVPGKFTSLAGETNIEKLLCQGWVMDDDLDVLANSSEAEGNYPYRCFYFFDDHTYTRNVRNAMEYGTWAYDEEKKMIAVKSSGGSKDEYKIAAIGPTDMIVLNSTSNSSTKLTYLAKGIRYKNNNDDPFYIDNNRWRIKPTTSETEEQVRKRLKECIWFHILFYRDNVERKEKVISFYGFPTCLKWYGGGIGLIKEEELPENWFACFYNREQALKAQKIMGTIVSKKYKWSTAKISWVKKNLEVLEQMYANL